MNLAAIKTEDMLAELCRRRKCVPQITVDVVDRADAIIAETAARHGVMPACIRGPRGTARVAAARDDAAAAMAEAGMSRKVIAAMLCRDCASTITKAIRRHKDAVSAKAETLF